MYISIYDDQFNHITNIEHITFSLTQRVYDFDSFTAEGLSKININDNCLLIVNDELGNYIYSCFIDTIHPENDIQKIKGKDFKKLFDTEILLDYTKPNSFEGKLSSIFKKVCDLVFDSKDNTIQKIKVKLHIPIDETNTIPIYGDLQNTYKIVNAYSFLKAYLKYYEYNIRTKINESSKKIEIYFEKNTDEIEIELKDFIHELETTSQTTNKAVATIIYKDFIEEQEDGTIIVKPRPNTIATKYYYRTTTNQIVESNENGEIDNRIYPVFTKIFESEYLADAQFDAVYELANARYVDNIILDNHLLIDPIDLSNYKLYTKFHLFYQSKFYKTLPITEKNLKLDGNGQSCKIKLGFKKILLTEIIKERSDDK